MLHYSHSYSQAFINPALRPAAANKTEAGGVGWVGVGGLDARMSNNQRNERKFKCVAAQLQLLIKTDQLS